MQMGSPTMKEDMKSPTKEKEAEEISVEKPKKKMDLNDTYAALRNHRIRFEDAIDPNAERVDKLRNNDILFGRGKGYQNHPGNRRMREIIEKYKRDYHSLKRSAKRKMVEAVYNEITSDGSRFLKKLDNEDGFVMVDAPVALQKVSHTLRCRKSTEKHLHALGLSKSTGFFGGNAAETGISALATGASLNLGLLGAPEQIMGAQAQYLAALQRYQGLVPGSMGLQTYNTMLENARREQLIRDTLLLQKSGSINPFVMKHGS